MRVEYLEKLSKLWASTEGGWKHLQVEELA